ncbi:unnamed protein product [Blepharisma stoltei]|uniref:Uncharacterized protein n=1 Tax=Blepharisma stoltei TaxID=1481888 RepID=A0AAU9JFY3_9CILI|nr:unnamed protein product [Blepharisma stoltei]
MDKRTLLKIYDSRVEILKQGPMEKTKCEDLLKELEIDVELSKLSSIVWKNLIRPELLIESVLQKLKKNRDYEKEHKFSQILFEKSECIRYEKLKEMFGKWLSNIYEKNEICRILHVIKKFALNSRFEVEKGYFVLLIRTCDNFSSNITSNLNYFKVLYYALNKCILRDFWVELKSYDGKRTVLKELNKAQQDKIRNLPIKAPKINNFYEKENFSKIITEKSSKSLGEGYDEIYTSKAVSLRNKLFFKICEKIIDGRYKTESKSIFQQIIAFAKSRGKFIDKTYIKLCIILQNCFSRSLRSTFDNLQRISLRKNSFTASRISFEREDSICSFSHNANSIGFINGTYRMNYSQSLCLSFALKSLFQKKLNESFFIFKKALICPIKNLTKTLDTPISKFKRSIFTELVQLTKIQEITSSIQGEISQELRKLRQNDYKSTKIRAIKFLNSKGKSIQFFKKIFLWKTWRIKILESRSLKDWKKFNKKQKFVDLSVKMSSSVPQTPKQVARSPKRALKKSKCTSSQLILNSQATSEKYDDLNNSVKRIRFHHGIEKLWLAKRMIIKRLKNWSPHRAFSVWLSAAQISI